LLFTKWYTRTYHEKLLVSEKANMTLFMERELRFVQKKTPQHSPPCCEIPRPFSQNLRHDQNGYEDV
jgi:hypothetical protein